MKPLNTTTSGSKDNLTICTVSFHNASLLDLNMSLTRELNQAVNYHWIVVDNGDDFSETGPHGSMLLKGDPCGNPGKLRGSYHHAQSLNKALGQVATRFLLVLDPDFFILRKNWIEDVLAHISGNGIGLWGAPYYPHATWKRRYVPAAYCMLIDLERIPRQRLDFTPELDEYHALFACSTWVLVNIRMGNIPPGFASMNREILQSISGDILRNRLFAVPLSKLFPKRFYINTNVSRDTGFKIQNNFGNLKYGVETLKPSFVNDLYSPKKNVLLGLFARMYALLVPETLSIYPKRRDYATPARFVDFDLPDLKGQFGWEEYFWKEKPFAMHIKSGTRKFEDVGYARLKEILRSFAGESDITPSR